MSDNRRAPRRRCLIGARVMLKEQASTINCVVRSLSETGAKIEFEAIQLLPQQFVIRLDTGVEYTVKSIAWQRDRQVGVVFCETSQASDEKAFAHNRLMNAVAFQEEISTQAPDLASGSGRRPDARQPSPCIQQSDPAPHQDFGLVFRKRLLESQRKQD